MVRQKESLGPSFFASKRLSRAVQPFDRKYSSLENIRGWAGKSAHGPARKEASMTSRAQRVAGWRRPLAVAGIALLLLGNYALAQNLGAAPQTNVAVQGRDGSAAGRSVPELHQLDRQRHRPGSSRWRGGRRHRFLAHGTGIRPLAVRGRGLACGVGRDAVDRVLDHERHGRRSLARA